MIIDQRFIGIISKNVKAELRTAGSYVNEQEAIDACESCIGENHISIESAAVKLSYKIYESLILSGGMKKLNNMTRAELEQVMARNNMLVTDEDTRESMIQIILNAIDDEDMVRRMLDE